MVWKNLTKQLAITSRRKILATALLYGISATVRLTSPAGEDTGRPAYATQRTGLMTSVTPRDDVEIFHAANVVQRPDRRNTIHAGHSTGDGQAVRPVSRLHTRPHTRLGGGRVAKLVLIGALLPLMLKTAASPGSWPMFDGLHKEHPANRSKSFRDVAMAHDMRTPHADVVNTELLSFVTT